MRNAFAQELTKIARHNKDIVFLSGDIGNRLFNEYKEYCPDRFYNCGVAEANMTGLAAGMAMSGLLPITYTITPFATVRCLEQIRDDVCYHNLPVIIVGVGSGLSYAGLGATHHSLEDIAMMRSLPNMTVVCPGDPVEVKYALRAALKRKGPFYLRLGKKGEPVIHDNNIHFAVGKVLSVRPGDDICILSTGNVLPLGLELRNNLLSDGHSTALYSFHTVKPLDTIFLENVFSNFKLVVSIEEHSKIGGLSSAIAEWIVDWGKAKAKFMRVATDDVFLSKAGNQDYAREHFGLTPSAMKHRILNVYQKLDNVEYAVC
jgi:transketolase